MASTCCPHCNTTISPSAVRIEDEHAFMPNESSETRKIYDKAVVPAVVEAKYPYEVSYAILECQECHERFVAKLGNDDEDWVPVYPIPHKPVAEEIPEPVKSEFEEASLCFAVGAYRACVSMCQRTQESLCQNQKVSGLNELRDKGIILPALFDKATEIRLWAGIIKHKPIAESASKEDTQQLLTYLELILSAVYVERKQLEMLKEKREGLEKGSV